MRISCFQGTPELDSVRVVVARWVTLKKKKRNLEVEELLKALNCCAVSHMQNAEFLMTRLIYMLFINAMSFKHLLPFCVFLGHLSYIFHSFNGVG